MSKEPSDRADTPINGGFFGLFGLQYEKSNKYTRS